MESSFPGTTQFGSDQDTRNDYASEKIKVSWASSHWVPFSESKHDQIQKEITTLLIKDSPHLDHTSKKAYGDSKKNVLNSPWWRGRFHISCLNSFLCLQNEARTADNIRSFLNMCPNTRISTSLRHWLHHHSFMRFLFRHCITCPISTF